MPLLTLHTTESMADEDQDRLMERLSTVMADITGKSEEYIMVLCEDGYRGYMAGDPSSAVFADVRGIGGLDAATNLRLSQSLCAEIEQATGTPAANIYLNFTDIPASNWGWDGRTFG